MIYHEIVMAKTLEVQPMIMIVIVVLWTKPFGLYGHQRGLRLHKVGYRERNLHIRIANLAFHAKESPIRTRDKVFNLVS